MSWTCAGAWPCRVGWIIKDFTIIAMVGHVHGNLYCWQPILAINIKNKGIYVFLFIFKCRYKLDTKFLSVSKKHPKRCRSTFVFVSLKLLFLLYPYRWDDNKLTRSWFVNIFNGGRFRIPFRDSSMTIMLRKKEA